MLFLFNFPHMYVLVQPPFRRFSLKNTNNSEQYGKQLIPYLDRTKSLLDKHCTNSFFGLIFLAVPGFY